MTETVRQLRALALTYRRILGRAPDHAAPGPKTRLHPILALVGGEALLVAVAWPLGSAYQALPLDGRASALRVALWGIFASGLAPALLAFGPQEGARRSLLRHPLLDALPLTTTTRVLATMAGAALLIPIWTSFLVAATGSGQEGTWVLTAVAAAILVVVTANLVGQALVASFRVARIRPTAAALRWLLVAVGNLPFILVVSGLLFGPGLDGVGDPMLAASTQLLRGRLGLGAWLILLAAAATLIAGCERMGFDRVDSTRSSGRSPPRAMPRSRGGFELALALRSDSGRAAVMASTLSLLLAALTTWGFVQRPERMIGEGGFTIGAVLVQLVFLLLPVLLVLGDRAVARDLDARPLLEALPRDPLDSLRARSRALFTLASPAMLGLCAVAASALLAHGRLPPGVGIGIVTRTSMTILALGMLCRIAVDLAALARGVEPHTGVSAIASSLFSRSLVLVPLLGVAGAPSIGQAALSCSTLLALAYETRRAALRSETWSHDADPTVARDTATWRALVVLGTFVGVEVLGAQAATLLPVASRPMGTVIATAIALVVLGVASWRWCRATPSVAFASPGMRRWLIGLVAGLCTAAASIGLAPVLRRIGWDARSPLEGLHGPGAGLLLLIALTLAPLVEEAFFRGWFQSAVAQDLGPRRAAWAPVIVAAAFALLHPGGLFLPQLALGLAAGLVRARSGALGPAIAAHVAHNAMVLLYG